MTRILALLKLEAQFLCSKITVAEFPGVTLSAADWGEKIPKESQCTMY